MLTITTAHNATGSGKGTIVAKGKGKQRTVNYDHARSLEANYGSAAGALLNVLLDDRQQAMLRHPSGGQRVRVEHRDQMSSKIHWTINV